MSEGYYQLLDAAIRHVEGLKASGAKFVPVSPQTLGNLARAARTTRGKSPRSSPDIPQRAAESRAPNVPRVEKPAIAQPAPPGLAVPPNAPQTEAAAADLAPEAKTAAFEDLRGRAAVCVKCSHLVAARKNVVFGVGNINAQLMFVGEAPGADEDEQGEPFVGKAGQLLTRIIQTMGMTRESVYIANILKCRPDTPGQSAGNRKPRPEEMQTCIPYLHEQIDLIRPKVLVALGGTAVEGLLGKTVGITRLRGHWQMYRGIPLMPTYHPAYLLRNQSMSEKRKVWEDMLQVMERLGISPTAKQRGYFRGTADAEQR